MNASGHDDRQRLGRWGEEQALQYLQEQGYTLLARNYRVQGGEIDIIAQQAATVVFVEVKTRRSTAFGAPEEAVTTAKQAKIRAVARQWLQMQERYYPRLRFDVLTIQLQGGQTRITHIENAF